MEWSSTEGFEPRSDIISFTLLKHPFGGSLPHTKAAAVKGEEECGFRIHRILEGEQTGRGGGMGVGSESKR